MSFFGVLSMLIKVGRYVSFNQVGNLVMLNLTNYYGMSYNISKDMLRVFIKKVLIVFIV